MKDLMVPPTPCLLVIALLFWALLASCGGQTPLMRAAMDGDTARIEALLKEGADINQKHSNGDSALLWATHAGQVNAVRTLLDRGAAVDPRTPQGITPLMEAAALGHMDIANLLLDRGARLAAKTEGGQTALIIAATNGQTNMVAFLLDRGAEINDNINGATSLIQASANGHAGVVRVLLERGANVNTLTQSGDTALSWAAARGHVEIVRLLLEKGANPRTVNVNGQTAAALAQIGQHPEIAGLIEQRMNPTAPSKAVGSMPTTPSAQNSDLSMEAAEGNVPSGRLQGLYYYEYNTNKHDTDFYLFTADGRVFNGLPAGGVRSFTQINLTPLCQRSPQQCGTYAIQGKQITFRWSGGRPSAVLSLQLRSEKGANDVAMIDDKEYYKVTTVTGGSLNGAYYWTSKGNPGVVMNSGSPLPGGPIHGGMGDNISVSSSEHFLVFYPNGQFQEIHASAFGSFTDRPMGAVADSGRRVVGQGNYTVQEHTLDLRYQNGQRKLYTFFIAPQFWRNIYLDGDDLSRCIKQDRNAPELEKQLSAC